MFRRQSISMSKKNFFKVNHLILAGLFWLVICSNAYPVWAANEAVVATPGVVDENGGIRQTIERQVKIKNNTASLVELYAVISDLEAAKGAQNSLSSWLEISHGVVSLQAGEEKQLPLKIVVGANAQPGRYHAQIIFARGSNRWEAEANSKNSIQAKTLVNFNLEEKIVEKLNNAFFRTAKSISTENKTDFSFHLKNIGNAKQTPSGTIIIFNRNGEEVASLAANSEGKILKAGEESDFVSSWQAGNQAGKFKAKLEIAYGRDNDKSISDTLFFWVLPKWILYLLASVLGLLLVILVYLFVKLKTPGAHGGSNNYNHTIDLKRRVKNQ